MEAFRALDTVANAGATAPISKKEAQTAAAKRKICEATIRCLEEHGYAETSINRIVDQAGVSRGALQHHFPTKEDLISETADRLLQRAVRPDFSVSAGELTDSPDDGAAVEEDILWTWEKLVNTKEYRALMEILAACRTDKALQARLSDRLLQWNDAIDSNNVAGFESVDRDDDDVRVLWTMARAFMRGLLIQDRYARDPAEHAKVLRRFIELVAPQMRKRRTAK